MAVKPIQVSQLNGYIKRVLQSDPLLGNVSVIGEISNWKLHGTGNAYFSLKDEFSKINCFLPGDRLAQLRYALEDGMEAVVSGYIHVYEKGGSYSLNVRDVELFGTGSLSIAFQNLKEKLEKEGLFDPKHKKPLPAFPRKIAIVTSSTGAAIEDMLKIIKSKNNVVDILIVPVAVQGTAAAGQIAKAIDMVNKDMPETDLIITGRGGGSIEELWAFNEEIVARSIYASNIPVISAVGHEIDVTIADFTADRRAETPTAAAHMAVPDIGELKETLKWHKENLQKTISRYVMDKEHLLQSFGKRALVQSLENKIALYGAQTHALKMKLDALNPRNIMSMGYGAILDQNGKLQSSIGAFKPGDSLTVILSDGSIPCDVRETIGGYDGKE